MSENQEIENQERRNSGEMIYEEETEHQQIMKEHRLENSIQEQEIIKSQTRESGEVDEDNKLHHTPKQYYDIDTSDEKFVPSGSQYIPHSSSDSEKSNQKRASNELTSTPTVECIMGTQAWTKRNTCPYCFQEVTHFPRHLQKHHKDEGAVKQYLSMSLNNPSRKQLLNSIRRQGNFMSNTHTNMVRPVRRPKAQYKVVKNSENAKEKYSVCVYCLGYFSRNYLRRHRKLCALRSEKNAPNNREQHLTAAQLFEVCVGKYKDFYTPLRIKDEVFTILRNDEISKTAMCDILICSYAESLLRKHTRPRIKNVISNKMRELGRLLICLRKVTGVQRLIDALNPAMFDNFVSATKIISGYDDETRTFRASSLALHMGTTLKQVCNEATNLITKKTFFLPVDDQEQSLKDIKRLKNLIENHWNAEISSLALKKLNDQKYCKPKLLPLTSDVVKFQQFALKEAKEAREGLRKDCQRKAEYRRLTECVLALALLLNRKRIGEIQYLKVQSYSSTLSQVQQEECLLALSETEKTLTKSFKRVITEGKDGNPVPILFSKDIQELISVLLNVRSLYVRESNEYLFANTNAENKWISGYHALKKLAKLSKVNDITLFTSTRLPKQIASILQILSVTENEVEQFASFMGHTKKTHENYYRLPQDIYQTAKVSKLLMAINSGKAHLYQGKTLDEIDLSDNLESDSDSDANITSHSTANSGEEEIPTLTDATSLNCAISNVDLLPGLETSSHQPKNQNITTKKKKTGSRRIRWSEEQIEVVRMFFKDHIKNKRAPGKHEIEKFIDKYRTVFNNKNWVQIKAYIYNSYR